LAHEFIAGNCLQDSWVSCGKQSVLGELIFALRCIPPDFPFLGYFAAYNDSQKEKSMADNGQIIIAGLYPHPPIAVPGIGRGREEKCAATMAAMSILSQKIVAAKPQCLVIIAPHSPRDRVAFGIWRGERLAGSLIHFGCPSAAVDLPNNEDFNKLLVKAVKNYGLQSWRVSGDFSEDHSAIVPLWYLVKAGWQGPVSVISLNYPGSGGLDELGLAIAAAAKEYGHPVAFIASGDMSHRLLRNAPAGYHPQAKMFDSEFVELLNRGDYEHVKSIDADLRNLAAEDVVDSTLVAMSATGYRTRGRDVLSYEGPFGVGYTVAVLYDANGEVKEKPYSLDMLLDYARAVVTAEVKGREAPKSPPPMDELARKAGVFVTIYESNGNLRGCMGTIGPTEPNVVRQTEYCAKMAACEDPRFYPIRPEELSGLKFEVGILHEPEPADSEDDLDPKIYGVIISTADGRRALMLPGIEQLDTVEKQLLATRQKAGIGPTEPVTIMRFKVDKIK